MPHLMNPGANVGPECRIVCGNLQSLSSVHCLHRLTDPHNWHRTVEPLTYQLDISHTEALHLTKTLPPRQHAHLGEASRPNRAIDGVGTDTARESRPISGSLKALAYPILSGMSRPRDILPRTARWSCGKARHASPPTDQTTSYGPRLSALARGWQGSSASVAVRCKTCVSPSSAFRFGCGYSMTPSARN